MYELIPMLALTGNPTREKICDTLKAFKKNGVTAVLLYPVPAVRSNICPDAGLRSAVPQ